MDQVKIGDILEMQCYHHDGVVYRDWDKSIVIDITDDYIVCGNNKVKVTEIDGRSWKTKEPAILFFYKKKWFNVIAQFKESGIFYYCNIMTPFIIEDKTIKYIDYDMDLRVFPDGTYKILDKSEYEYHKSKMNYPKEIDDIVKYELKNLISLIGGKFGPFSLDFVNNYYKKYLEVLKNIN